MKRAVLTNIIGLLLLMLPYYALSDEIEIEKLEVQIATLDSIWNELQSRYKYLSERAKEKAQRISNLRREEPLSFIKRRQLESLLKESLVLTQEMENLHLKIKNIRQDLKAKRDTLIRLYDQQIERLLKILESNPSATQRKITLAELRKIKEKKSSIQKPLFQEQLFLREPKIILKINENDTPHSLKEKADYLKDQEDRHRKYANNLEEKIKELEKELNLRERMADFISDLALFDQQEEPLQKKGTEISSAEFRPTEVPIDNREETSYQEKDLISNDNFLNPEVGTYSLQSLTVSDIEVLIERLKKEQLKTNKASDSLSIQAEKFYQAAEARKKNSEKK